MTNHPNRSRGPYTAQMGGASWAQGPAQQFATIRECRAWAEEHGDSADYCAVTDAKGRVVASHRRDPNAPGGWFRATI